MSRVSSSVCVKRRSIDKVQREGSTIITQVHILVHTAQRYAQYDGKVAVETIICIADPDSKANLGSFY